MSVKACITTEKGKKLLGRLLKYSRDARSWSIDDLIVEIQKVTGHKISKSAISELERGNTEPRWNTLAILAATGYVVDWTTGKPLKTSDLFEVACEIISPSHHLNGANLLPTPAIGFDT